jgi:ADP-ribosyl-[dinitrogen reductase] hydrolase
MWCGIRASGVYSAGNGPSMRSAIIGAVLSTDAEKRRAHVEASTRLTHTDPKALAGASAVAEVAAKLASGEWPVKPNVDEFISTITRTSSDGDWLSAVAMIRRACESHDPITTSISLFATKQGVSGYALHSVPFALVVWFHHFGHYRSTIECITQAGGDVDTVAAIAGTLAGTTGGQKDIPQEWIDHLFDWPHSVSYLLALSVGLNDPSFTVPINFSWWLFPRGLIFTLVVLAHGVRRLFPPY